jgi:hypothetical protein
MVFASGRNGLKKIISNGRRINGGPARQTDGYGGYNFLDKNTDIVHVACWVHARRKFKAVTNALKYISELYKKDAV